MAGYDNIKDKGFDKRTTGEVRAIAKKGGQASGQVRRRKADFRKALNMLLTAKIDSPEWEPILQGLGVDTTLESAMLMSMVQAALKGDVKAAYFVAQYAGQSDKSEADEKEQSIRTDRAKRARDQEVGDGDSAEDNIKDFLRAIRPNDEDIDEMFEEEVDGEIPEETEGI